MNDLNWFFLNKNKIGLKLVQFNWTSKWSLNLFDYRASISLDGRDYVGRGTDCDESLAIKKAISEAFEEYICCLHGIQSSGVALHTNLENAKTAAKNELLERDIFFTHFLNSFPFTEHKESRFYNISNKLRYFGFDLKFYTSHFKHSHMSEYVMCCIFSRNEGGCVGLGYDSDFNTAASKALNESLRNVVARINGEINSISIDEFRKIRNPSPKDHLKLSFDSAFWELFHSRFLKVGPAHEEQSLDYVPLSFKELDFNISIVHFPLFAVRAESQKVQIPFWGDSSKAELNQFRRFNKTEREVIIHPLG